LLHERPENKKAQHACCSNGSIQSQPAGQKHMSAATAMLLLVLVLQAVMQQHAGYC
jgi:hypothetical protein